MRVLLLVAFTSLGLSAAAVAKEPAEDKVICKRQYEPDTGSHFRNSKKVCMKRSEWKQLDQETQQTMRRINDNGNANPEGTQGGGAPQ